MKAYYYCTVISNNIKYTKAGLNEIFINIMYVQFPESESFCNSNVHKKT